MKKFTFILLAIFALCSCSVSTYIVADISLMDNEGKVISKWEGATMQTSTSSAGSTLTTFGGIKNGGGLNFIDSDNIAHYVSGGIIHADNLRELTESEYNKQKAEPLIKEYSRLQGIYNEDKKTIKTIDNTDVRYSVIKERIKKVESRMNDISNEVWKKYGYNLKYMGE